MKIYLKILCRSRIPHSHQHCTVHSVHQPCLALMAQSDSEKKKSYDFNNYRNKIEYIPEGLPRLCFVL